MATRPSLDETFMSIAEVLALRSTCSRRSVGCVLVNDKHHIVSTGYNGNASGLSHCTDTPCPGANMVSGTGLELCEALHAEQNALMQCKDVYNIKTCYTTTMPCMTCAKLLASTSCQEIVYLDKYPSADSVIEYWSYQLHRQIRKLEV